MKKHPFTSLVLFLVLVLPFFAGLAGFSWRITWHRSSMVEQLASFLPGTWTETLVIAKDELHTLRFEHEGEFEYRGTMFDVIYRSETVDSVFFTVWRDSEETVLVENRRRLLTFSTFPEQSEAEHNGLSLLFGALKKSLPVARMLLLCPSTGIVHHFAIDSTPLSYVAEAPPPPPPEPFIWT